ncbi:MAG: MFS transporter [Woeseiaceae bacterium]
MLALIVAGEIVFGLPFHTARFFRPTLLEVFGFTNTQLGDLFAVYGITAMLAYFPGGALADRYSARFLLTASLLATAAGGLFMVTIPAAFPMAILYGYWGITSVFLFWGALIRATREWGGRASQGLAFGILEGGRGVVAALVSTLALLIFAAIMPDNVGQASDEVRRAGMQSIILVYSCAALAAAALTWLTVPVPDPASYTRSNPLHGMGVVLRRPVIWAQAAVIICAYCGYKGLDNYSLYAVQVLGMDEVRGAALATYGAWVRPFAAVFVGLVADRFSAARSIAVLFGILIVAYLLLGTSVPDASTVNIVYANLFVTFFAVFALRGVYFALLEENRTPAFLTGAAVGLVSLIGYTPEVFFAPITGRILDANHGIVGFQHYFLFLAAIAALGVVVVVWLLWLRTQGQEKLWPAKPAGLK